ncbi:MAG: type III PLP-dependent enzyme, partial [Rickettsiales bacterium]|nr:type III PLP-dependent enzyme [Rickettsiales bacterium]
MEKLQSISSLVLSARPDNPLHIFRPGAVDKAACFFQSHFQGKVLYAVKTNPEPCILKQLYQLGITSFDVASLEEIRLVHEVLPQAHLHFMHTIKSRRAIREAYHEYGVRDFSLDSKEELQKILEETNQANDLNLYVRLAIPNTYAELNLADKFGATLKEAAELLRATRSHAVSLGICFHVGSQCMHPDAYRIAIRMAAKVIRESKVKVDALDVGGGFPSIYPGMMPPEMDHFFAAIHEEFAKIRGSKEMTLMCEPGRALVAESGSVIVKVELRKGDRLYINDGTYGSLFDAGTPHFIFPVKLIRPESGVAQKEVIPFSFFGPTCDTLDFMKGPFYLPEDVREGDYIEV